MTLHTQIRQQLLGNLTQSEPDELAQLNNALRLVAKWRSVLIQNTLLQQQGTVVMEGPLKGLDFLPQSAEGEKKDTHFVSNLIKFVGITDADNIVAGNWDAFVA